MSRFGSATSIGWWAPIGMLRIKLLRWKLSGDDLIAEVRQGDGSVIREKDNDRWVADQNGVSSFWGIDNENHAVRWEKGADRKVWTFIMGSGWKESSGGPLEYVPLKKGFIRGDPGVSLRTGRPVSQSIFVRLRNSLVLAGIAFVIVMPLALFLGLLAGLKEGRLRDRALSVGGMTFSVIPEFATGIFLILIVAVWWKWVPGATVFGEKAPWERPDMLILPVLTLTLIELGYVLRITRASMVEVMRSPYIRTAYLKGLPYWRIVVKHAIRNALVAPITVIMLHVNWLMGGIVIVEVVFGYPGLGKYLLDSALNKDINALEAGAMILVILAVGTQLVADIIYTFLNPRIRYT
jgi:peptide/nickel transport system permease protein